MLTFRVESIGIKLWRICIVQIAAYREPFVGGKHDFRRSLQMLISETFSTRMMLVVDLPDLCSAGGGLSILELPDRKQRVSPPFPRYKQFLSRVRKSRKSHNKAPNQLILKKVVKIVKMKNFVSRSTCLLLLSAAW
jgi:hypothetical protein